MYLNRQLQLHKKHLYLSLILLNKNTLHEHQKKEAPIKEDISHMSGHFLTHGFLTHTFILTSLDYF